MKKTLVNYDDIAEDEQGPLKKALNVNPLQYQHFFRASLIGGSGVGKTNFLVNILVGDDNLLYDRVWLLAKDSSDPKYKLLSKHYAQKAQEITELYKKKTNRRMPVPILFQVFSSPADIPPFNDELKQQQSATVLIIDDYVNDRGVDTWLKNNIHYMRHFNISMFYLSQSWYSIPKFIRLQMDYVSLWNIPDQRTVDELLKTFNIGNSKNPKDRQLFLDYYNKALEIPYMPFTLDLTYKAQKDKKLRYRAGLLPITLQEEPADK